MKMRDLISLVEGLQTKQTPKLLFHGTNFIAAAQIVMSGEIRADNPVDDDDLGAVVCTTSSRKVARMFAVEFARVNSDYPVGAVFVIDPAKIGDLLPYSAETQGSVDEREYRVQRNIPLSSVVAIKLVGDTRRLTSESWLEHIYYEADPLIRRTFGDFARFYRAVQALVSRARQ